MHPTGTTPEERPPLRILHLASDYRSTVADGIASYTFQLGAALARRGHEFHVLSCAPHAKSDDYLDGSIHVHRRAGLAYLERAGSRTPCPWTLRHVYAALSHWTESARLRMRFDVVECPEFGACGLAVGMSGAWPLVVRVHTPFAVEAPFCPAGGLDVRLSDRLERALARRATILTTSTHRMAQQLKTTGWLDRDLRVIRNPIDVSDWARTEPVERTRPVILAIGRIESRKAPELLVRATAGLRHIVPGVETLFLGRSNGTRGSTPYRTWVRELQRELGAPCRFLDEIPREALLGIYGRARVVAITSWQEGFSYAGLEAMACGRPVVCTSNTGLAELLQGSWAGTVVPTGDHPALARALAPYLRSAEWAAEAGRCGRQLAETECEAEAVGIQIEGCYREAIRRWRATHAATRSASNDLGGDPDRSATGSLAIGAIERQTHPAGSADDVGAER